MIISKKTLVAAIAATALLAGSSAGRAEDRRKVERVRVVPAATAASFSTEVPIVQRTSAPNGGQTGTLVLNAAHSFNVTVVATNQHNNNVQGNGVALPQTDTFGYFSLPSITGNPSNPEIFVKILDGRPINGSYWVFYGHLTDLIYDITVKENATGIIKQYHKNAGNEAGGFDTTAFAGSSTVTSNLESTQIVPNAFVRTAVDIANNTSGTISADLQYAYTCTDPTCNPVGFFYRTSVKTISIPGLSVFHQDDVVQYFDSQSLLQTGAGQGSTGTLLVTFNNLPSNIGWEGTVTARNYNRISEVDPLRGTVGFDMNGSLFFESSNTTLVGTAVDTRSAPACTAPGTPAGCSFMGSVLTLVGIRNTDIFGTGNSVNVVLTLHNPANGQLVGQAITLSNIQPGEVRLVNNPDLFTQAGVPAGTSPVIVFADTQGHPPTAPTIEGFFLMQDAINFSARFNELRCADPTHCGP
jgi:hypothetical protein